MAGEDDQNINNQPPNPPPPTQQAPHTISTIKLPILKKGEYDIWAMKMEHYLAHTDYPVWEVIQNGNGPVSIFTDTQEDHLARFHNISDAKEMWEAVKTRFARNAENTRNKDKENRRRTRQHWYEEKIRFMKIDLDDKRDFLTYHKKLLAETEKEKEDLKTKVEKWHNSFKNLGILLNTQMSANDKFRLGYGDHRYDGILSYENEVLQSVFMNKESDLENQPLYDRFVTAEGMHAVPPPMTGNYMPSRPDIEIDYSQFTYGPKQSQPSESDTQISDFDTCESNISVEIPEIMSEPVVNEPNVGSQPKVWTDAPIIEEYKSDSDDYCVSKPIKEQEQPSFASTNKQVKTPRKTVKN
ncbi:hypothetical protein Tco_1408133 [Tanacetum coccineum]